MRSARSARPGEHKRTTLVGSAPRCSASVQRPWSVSTLSLKSRDEGRGDQGRARAATGATRDELEQAGSRHEPVGREFHMAVITERAAHATAIRPFTFEASDADLDDLRARI